MIDGKNSEVSMVRLDTGSDKVKKICEILKNETLDPARVEAEKIIEDAHASAERIMEEAREEITKVKKRCDDEVSQRMQVLESSLKIAAKKSLSYLRQAIQEELFDKELGSWVRSTSEKEDVVAKLIEAIISAVEKEGLGTKLEAILPKMASKEAVSKALSQKAIDRIKSEGLTVGEFFGGAQVKLEDENFIVDLSDDALRGLLAGYIGKDLREYVFGAE